MFKGNNNKKKSQIIKQERKELWCFITALVFSVFTVVYLSYVEGFKDGVSTNNETLFSSPLPYYIILTILFLIVGRFLVKSAKGLFH